MATRRAPAAACLSTRAKRENSSTLVATNAVTRACSVTKAVSCARRPRTIETRSQVFKNDFEFIFSISFFSTKKRSCFLPRIAAVGFGRVRTRVIDQNNFFKTHYTPIEKLPRLIQRKGANVRTGFAQKIIFQNITTRTEPVVYKCVLEERISCPDV